MVDDQFINSKLLSCLKIDKALMWAGNLNLVQIETAEWVRFLATLNTADEALNQGPWEDKVRALTKAIIDKK